MLSRLVHATDDKGTITGWKSDLNRVLQVFTVRSAFLTQSSLIVPAQTELVMSAHIMVSDLHRNVFTSQEGADSQHPSVSTTFYH